MDTVTEMADILRAEQSGEARDLSALVINAEKRERKAGLIESEPLQIILNALEGCFRQHPGLMEPFLKDERGENDPARYVDTVAGWLRQQDRSSIRQVMEWKRKKEERPHERWGALIPGVERISAWLADHLSKPVNIPLLYTEGKQEVFPNGRFVCAEKRGEKAYTAFRSIQGFDAPELHDDECKHRVGYWNNFKERIPKLHAIGQGLSAVFEDQTGRPIIYKWVNPLRVERADHEIEIARKLRKAGIPVPQYYGILDFGGAYFLVIQRLKGIDLQKVFFSSDIRKYVAVPDFVEYLARNQMKRPSKAVRQEDIKEMTEQTYRLLGGLAARLEHTPVQMGDFQPRNTLLVNNREPEVYVIDLEHAQIGEPQKMKRPEHLDFVQSAAYRAGYNAEKRRLAA